MNERVTLQDIASAAGLSKSGVSLALRRHPSIPASTCARVREIADRMGYRPDPTLAALSGYRHRHRKREPETLAWVSTTAMLGKWRQSPAFNNYFLGACARADELGYRVEELGYGIEGMNPDRFDRILQTRGIRGLLIGHVPESNFRIEIRWEKYSVVQVGTTFKHPRLHTVACSYSRTMALVLTRLRQLGYHRIGAVIDRRINVRVEHAWIGALFTDQHRHPGRDAVAPLLLRKHQKQRFFKWMKENQPEVLVTAGMPIVEAVPGWCAELGLEIPRDIGIAVGSNISDDSSLSGIRERSHLIGASAVDQLASMLYHNERGIPGIPRRTSIEGEWIHGDSLKWHKTPEIS